MDTNLIAALRTLRCYSPIRLDVYTLAGTRHGKVRAQLMAALTGRKHTIAKSGVTALREAFFDACGIAPTGWGCEANRVEAFEAAATERLNAAGYPAPVRAPLFAVATVQS